MKYFIAIIIIVVFPLYAQDVKSGIILKELKIRFFADHLFKKVKGECKNPKVDNLKFRSSSNGILAEVPFSISCSILNMQTGDENRDSHLWEILGYPNNKEVTFYVEKLDINQKGVYSFQGNLKIKDTTKSISFTANSKKDNDLKINAAFDIVLSDFKVERPSVVFTPIKDKVRIEWEALVK